MCEPAKARWANAAQGVCREAIDGFLPHAVQEARRVCQDFGVTSLFPLVDAADAALRDSGVLDVAVVGRFKGGKSSLLNLLIGRDILPVAVLPVTAVVTRIRYGPQDRATVRHLDGRQEDVPLERLSDYVTEQGNPGNVKQVAIVDVEVTDLLPYMGVRFVDTPGLGSVFAHNTQVSMDWLPRVGAAFLAVSSDHPLSEDDVRLLEHLGRHTPEVAILITKADLVSAGDLAAIAQFISEQTAGRVRAGLHVLPISTRPGFERLAQGLREFLDSRIVSRRAEKAAEILRHKVQGLLAGCREYLGVALSAASAAEEARLQLRRELEKEQRDLASVRNEVWLLATDLKGRLQKDALQRFLEHYGELTQGLDEDLRRQMHSWRGNLARTTALFEEWTREAMVARLVPLSHEEGGQLADRHVDAIRASLERVVRGFQDRLAQGIQRALGVRFSGTEFEVVVMPPRRPDVSIDRVFDTPVELLWFLIPMWMVRPLVNRHFLRMLPWEVEKNLCRLAAQWTAAIGRCVDDVAREAQDFIQGELATVEDLLEKAPDRRAAVEKALAEIEDLQSRLCGK
jgi:GTP-binding protein EngB required for normal cell division